MNVEMGNNEERDELEEEGVAVAENEDISVDIDESDAHLAGATGEINVDELVAKIESKHGDEVDRKRAIKKRLDEHLLQDDEFGSTYNFNIDEDLK
ncbi:MAG: hypothetical protein AAF351_07610 [Pseudomonadota bacterium]